MSRQIALGIIGCGRVTAEIHLPALRSVGEFRAVALADVASGRASGLSNSLADCRAYSHWEELLHDSRVEAVAICTPPAAHAQPAITALAANKHVLVEKPLASELHDACRIAASAQTSNAVGIVGFNLRFHRLVNRARALIRTGALGRIHHVTSFWGTTLRDPTDQANWRGQASKGGGALADLAPHHIDLCRALLQDEFQTIYAIEDSIRSEADVATLTGRTRKGTSVSAVFSLCAAPAHRIAIIGDAATVSFAFDRPGSFRTVFSGSATPRLGQAVQRLIELPQLVRSRIGGGEYSLSYSEQWRHFAAAIRREPSACASLSDGVAAQCVIDAARKSSLTRSPQPVLHQA